MPRRTRGALICACLGAWVLAGCVGPDTPPDPSYAVLKGTDRKLETFNHWATQIMSVDGKPPRISNTSRGVPVAAGMHKIMVGFYSLAYGFAEGEFKFDLIPGEIYRLEVIPMTPTWERQLTKEPG